MPSKPHFTPTRLGELATDLVDWYREHQRDLPWRRTRDPYAIWVSEVMLQQTRVEAVVGRYQQFMRRFPDIGSLAVADESEVLAQWAGLGYYRRARQLHAAARRVVEQEGGRLPRVAAALRLLPGFGAYTAGAVASIAFDQPVPAVDGNVERVISRLLALDENPKKGAAAVTVREVAQAMVLKAPPHELNQALMELGATVCTPRSPQCERCPWTVRCAGRRSGAPDRFPRVAPRKAAVDVTCYAAVARDGDRLLWRRRPPGGHNAGLWELPTTEWHGGAADPDMATQQLAALALEMGGQWKVGEPVATVRHGITHHRVSLVGYAVTASPAAYAGPDLIWATAEEARELGLTAAAQKLSRKLPPLL